MENIEDIIRSNIKFRGVSSHGWNTTYCEVCGDGSRTKGPRGGWLFNGPAAFYHCFNCGLDGNFDHTREQPYSKNMWNILTAFDIPMNEVQTIVNEYNLENNFKKQKTKKVVRNVKEIDVPEFFYKLSNASDDNPVAQAALKLLKEKRISPKSYPFYLSNGKSDGEIREKMLAKSLTNRLIIPFFKRDKLVYYQGRSLDDKQGKKYLNAEVSRSNIIYGFDKLYSNLDNYLFVTEGFFDAFHLDGVSVQENKLSNAQIDILSQSPRTKVIVPDYNGDSYQLAEQAIELGWGISLPEYDYKDTTEAIQNIGKIATLQYIMNSIYFDFEAETQLMVKKL